jgi:hypothetical protein
VDVAGVINQVRERLADVELANDLVEVAGRVLEVVRDVRPAEGRVNQ